QFQVTITNGASPAIGDILDFALIAASNDANVQKQLLFAVSSSTFNNGRSKLTIAPSGGFKLTGQPSNYSVMDKLASGGTYYTFVDSGAFTVSYASMTNMDESGLQLAGNN